ncbi:MAG TPA: hypothetical protein PKM51_03075 [Chitinophagales bacterium]|nr:hypothetical protein [Chitinophagales bacterium]
MNYLLRLSLAVIGIVFFLNAKAVEKGDFHATLTTNLGHHSFIPTYDLKAYNHAKGKFEKFGFIPGVTLNMDYAASPYFSIGGWFTFSGRAYTKDSSSVLFDLKYRSFGIGVRGVFHLYQLISEKGNAKLEADKFDVYIPLSIGGGFRLKSKQTTLPEYQKVKGGAIVGSGIGMTYYFVEHIGANLEAGYCEGSYAKIGLAFKF